MLPTYLILLLGLLGSFIIIIILRNPTIEHFSSKKETIIQDSLNWIKPYIMECKEKPNTATLISIDLLKASEKSPVKCYSLGLTNLDPVFQKPNTRTILTAKKGVIALLWSEKDGKGRLLGMLPNPTGTRTIFQKTNMNAKSITVKKRSDLASDILDKLEFTLPPRRWTCVKNGPTYFPKVATEIYGNVDEDKRLVKCTKNGRPYFADEMAKFQLYDKKPAIKPNRKVLEKKSYRH